MEGNKRKLKRVKKKEERKTRLRIYVVFPEEKGAKTRLIHGGQQYTETTKKA